MRGAFFYFPPFSKTGHASPSTYSTIKTIRHSSIPQEIRISRGRQAKKSTETPTYRLRRPHLFWIKRIKKGSLRPFPVAQFVKPRHVLRTEAGGKVPRNFLRVRLLRGILLPIDIWTDKPPKKERERERERERPFHLAANLSSSPSVRRRKRKQGGRGGGAIYVTSFSSSSSSALYSLQGSPLTRNQISSSASQQANSQINSEGLIRK